jgi:hypothetical protein
MASAGEEQYRGDDPQRAGADIARMIEPPLAVISGCGQSRAEKQERAFSHSFVLQSQVGFDDSSTTAHPVFSYLLVAL